MAQQRIDERSIDGMNGDVYCAEPAGLKAIEHIVQIQRGIRDWPQDEIRRQIRVFTDLGGEIGKGVEAPGVVEAGGIQEDGVLLQVHEVVKDHGEVERPAIEADSECQQQEQDEDMTTVFVVVLMWK